MTAAGGRASASSRAADRLSTFDGLGRHERAAVLAVAVLADGGYAGNRQRVVTAGQVSLLVGLASSTTERNLKAAAMAGLLEQVVSVAGVTHSYTGHRARQRPKGSRIMGYRIARAGEVESS